MLPVRTFSWRRRIGREVSLSTYVIRDLPFHNLDLIGLEGGDRLHGLLPAALLHRHLVPGLVEELGEMQVKGRPLDLDIGYHARPQQGAPLHAGAERGDERDRRVRVRILRQGHLLHLDGKAEGMQVQRAEAHGLTLQAGIHCRSRERRRGSSTKKLATTAATATSADRPDHQIHHRRMAKPPLDARWLSLPTCPAGYLCDPAASGP